PGLHRSLRQIDRRGRIAGRRSDDRLFRASLRRREHAVDVAREHHAERLPGLIRQIGGEIATPHVCESTALQGRPRLLYLGAEILKRLTTALQNLDCTLCLRVRLLEERELLRTFLRP